jgi:rubredoxin
MFKIEYRIESNPKKERKIKMKKYQCTVCGYVYDEEQGCPEQDIAPGTKWEDVPEDFTCPECGVGKDMFELVS